MVLTWGPDYLQFYNDAYAPLIGAKHPAIGEDIRITLAEGWDALGPPIAHAMETLEASWLPGLLLRLERSGYVRSEEHTSELQSRQYLVCRLLLEKKKKDIQRIT